MIDNDYQFALNYLIKNIEMRNRHSDGALYWSKNKLQELVNKSKPMTLFYEGDGYVDGELCYDTAICQNCGRHFERYFDEHVNYCPTCGQRLDWGDEK